MTELVERQLRNEIAELKRVNAALQERYGFLKNRCFAAVFMERHGDRLFYCSRFVASPHEGKVKEHNAIAEFSKNVNNWSEFAQADSKGAAEAVDKARREAADGISKGTLDIKKIRAIVSGEAL